MMRATRVAAEQNRAQIGAPPTNDKASELVAEIGDHSVQALRYGLRQMVASQGCLSRGRPGGR
jgi:hypothetical protein